jgi:hypothetical protein
VTFAACRTILALFLFESFFVALLFLQDPAGSAGHLGSSGAWPPAAGAHTGPRRAPASLGGGGPAVVTAGNEGATLEDTDDDEDYDDDGDDDENKDLSGDDTGPTLNDEARRFKVSESAVLRRSRGGDVHTGNNPNNDDNDGDDAAARRRRRKSKNNKRKNNNKKKKKKRSSAGLPRPASTEAERAARAAHPFAPHKFFDETRAHEELADEDFAEGHAPLSSSGDIARPGLNPLLSSAQGQPAIFGGGGAHGEAADPPPRKKQYGVLEHTGFHKTRRLPKAKRGGSNGGGDAAVGQGEASGVDALRRRIEWLLTLLCQRSPSMLLGFTLCLQTIVSRIESELGEVGFFQV